MDIAHTKDGKTFTCEEECQELKCHLKNVANYSKEFASFFDGGEAGEVIGLLHDAGKYQANFQDRIRGKNIRVDHATAGAKILVEKYNFEFRTPKSAASCLRFYPPNQVLSTILHIPNSYFKRTY